MSISRRGMAIVLLVTITSGCRAYFAGEPGGRVGGRIVVKERDRFMARVARRHDRVIATIDRGCAKVICRMSDGTDRVPESDGTHVVCVKGQGGEEVSGVVLSIVAVPSLTPNVSGQEQKRNPYGPGAMCAEGVALEKQNLRIAEATLCIETCDPGDEPDRYMRVRIEASIPTAGGEKGEKTGASTGEGAQP